VLGGSSLPPASLAALPLPQTQFMLFPNSNPFHCLAGFSCFSFRVDVAFPPGTGVRHICHELLISSPATSFSPPGQAPLLFFNCVLFFFSCSRRLFSFVSCPFSSLYSLRRAHTLFLAFFGLYPRLPASSGTQPFFFRTSSALGRFSVTFPDPGASHRIRLKLYLPPPPGVRERTMGRLRGFFSFSLFFV